MFRSRGLDKLASDLSAARSRIAELEAELSRLSSRDPISDDLLTLRAFRAQLELDVQRAQRYSRPLTVALIDIDRFRYINLRHGYGAGDLVLGGVAATIGRCARSHDVACRIGGDEFAILFGETEPEGALDAVRRILASSRTSTPEACAGTPRRPGSPGSSRARPRRRCSLRRARHSSVRGRPAGPGRCSMPARAAARPTRASSRARTTK